MTACGALWRDKSTYSLVAVPAQETHEHNTGRSIRRRGAARVAHSQQHHLSAVAPSGHKPPQLSLQRSYASIASSTPGSSHSESTHSAIFCLKSPQRMSVGTACSWTASCVRYGWRGLPLYSSRVTGHSKRTVSSFEAFRALRIPGLARLRCRAGARHDVQ